MLRMQFWTVQTVSCCLARQVNQHSLNVAHCAIAKGAYPVETVEMMHKLCREAESIIFYPPLFNELRAVTPKPIGGTEAIASSAVNACLEHDCSAIIVLTTTGNTARLLAKYRPRVPIITVTRYSKVPP